MTDKFPRQLMIEVGGWTCADYAKDCWHCMEADKRPENGCWCWEVKKTKEFCFQDQNTERQRRYNERRKVWLLDHSRSLDPAYRDDLRQTRGDTTENN